MDGSGEEERVITLEEVNEGLTRHTTKLSDVVRQAALGGIAVVWIFKTTTSAGTPLLSAWLIVVALLLVATLGADLLQYVALSRNWYRFSKEKHANAQAVADEALNKWPMRFFWGKVWLLAFAIAGLGGFAVVVLSGHGTVSSPSSASGVPPCVCSVMVPPR